MKRLAFLLLLAALAPAQAAPAVEGVLECMRQNVPPSVRVQDFELQVTDARGETAVLSGKLYAQREARPGNGSFTHAMMRVNAPDHLKGAAYLVRQTDDYLRDGMYVYLPSVKRVRRVSGTFADGALLGTTFSYYDFKQLANAFGDLEAQSLKQETIEGRPVHVLSFTALPGAETMYSGARAWIDQKACLPLKVEFLEKGQPRKRLTAEPAALRPYGKSWYLSESRIEDLRDKTTTTLRIVEVNDASLPSRYFNPKTFYLGN